MAKILDFIEEGQIVNVKNLRTYENYYTFEIRIVLHQLFKPVFEDIKVVVDGKCKIKEDDEIEVVKINKVKIDAYRGKNGVHKKFVCNLLIKPLTVHKIDW